MRNFIAYFWLLLTIIGVLGYQLWQSHERLDYVVEHSRLDAQQNWKRGEAYREDLVAAKLLIETLTSEIAQLEDELRRAKESQR